MVPVWYRLVVPLHGFTERGAEDDTLLTSSHQRSIRLRSEPMKNSGSLLLRSSRMVSSKVSLKVPPLFR
jgi:hypothetical protein